MCLVSIFSINITSLWFCIFICFTNILLLLIYKKCPIYILEKKYLNATMMQLCGILKCLPKCITTYSTKHPSDKISIEIKFFLMLGCIDTVKVLFFMLIKRE